MNFSSLQPIEAAVTLAVIWIGLGVMGLALMRAPRFITGFVFPVGALVSLALAATGLWAISAPPTAAILPAGLPDLPFHVRIDALSGFFLLLLGGVSFGISLFACGYFRDTEATALGLLSLQYHVFLASMAFVLIADDAYLFMLTWESMALSSYFLVTTEHHNEQNRKAGFIYLLVAHIGALGILLCFGVLHGGHGDYTFEALRQANLNGFWATVAFLLAFFGFGAKAGMLPLHVWLPEAHPAAPSPVSALLSGVMLKTAIYGMVRVIYDLIGGIRWEWGLTVLLFGAATSLFGVLFALMQHDLKRLLAYHSVENIGIILIGIGLSMVFLGSGHPVAAALGLIAGLYHTLNHAVFKGLLFLGAGAILKSTGLRNLNQMGGLIRYLPHTALYFLVGALAISALPPLNGFVSEWLTFQASLQAPLLQSSVVRSLVPIVAAVLALSGALTGMCFVKVYGIAFLGQQRQEFAQRPREASGWERAGMLWLALACFALGLFPVFMIGKLNTICLTLIGNGLSDEAIASGWLWLVPTASAQASYSPIVFLLVIAAVFGLTFLVVRYFYHGRLRRADAWDCGFPAQTSRMQDSADAFGQPIRQIFAPVYLIEREIPRADDPHPVFRQSVEDRHWYAIYLPIARFTEFLSGHIGKLQQGRISVYLLYSFITLIALLVFAQ
ncbi:MAG TPA: hydrogenase 4 subunit B [Burkholderiales bacterium]|jgi:formate hydrogenlyase subunit 3/multisubunit Na+/H+ antiporter MnhD subunit|nr:hydrogenase 4 subunit B [Burkholderiales bacterium]